MIEGKESKSKKKKQIMCEFIYVCQSSDLWIPTQYGVLDLGSEWISHHF